MTEITPEIRAKVTEIISQGLVAGLGAATPGELCVEAAICLAMGEPHSDKPSCVHEAARHYSIAINDRYPGTPLERAALLLPLALAELGTAGTDRVPWLARLAEGTIRKVLPIWLRYAAGMHPELTHRKVLTAAAERCESEGTRESAVAAQKIASYASYASASAYASAASAYASAADASAAYAYAASAYASYAASYAASDASSYACYVRKLAIETSVRVALDAYAAEGRS